MSDVIVQPRVSFRRMLPGETTHAFSAFCYYRDLGPERTNVAVAEKLGCGPGNVSTWSTRFQWAARVRWYDEVMSHVAIEQQKETMLAHMREEYEKRKELKDAIVLNIRNKIGMALEEVDASFFLRYPRLIVPFLSYADKAENELFAAVRTAEERGQSAPSLNLENLSDEQLEQLSRLADSIGGGQGASERGISETQAAKLLERGVAVL